MSATSQPSAAGLAAHTPTPWRFTHEGNTRRGRGKFLVILPEEDTVPVADVNRHRGPQSEANAAFIVRACNENARLHAGRDALAAEVAKLTEVDFKNAAIIDKLQAERDHFKSRFEWWMSEAQGIARDRAELMNAGERYPAVVAELGALLRARLYGTPAAALALAKEGAQANSP